MSTTSLVALGAGAIVVVVVLASAMIVRRLAGLRVKVDRVVERVTTRLDSHQKARGAEQARLLEEITAANRVLGQVREQDVPGLRTAMTKLGQRIGDDQRKRFRTLRDHVTAQGRRDYQQVVAAHELRDLLHPDRPMPALRGWAASPDVLCVVVELIRTRAPRLVVECGSGASSVWLGLALRRFGGGRLVSLEHDERYAALSRDLVAAHDLGDLVDVRCAPLRPWQGEEGAPEQAWYDLAAVRDLTDIELLFVDGPPQATGPEARFPAGPVLVPRCAPRCAIVLDDARRADETSTISRWTAAFGLRSRALETEKGTVVLERG